MRARSLQQSKYSQQGHRPISAPKFSGRDKGTKTNGRQNAGRTTKTVESPRRPNFSPNIPVPIGEGFKHGQLSHLETFKNVGGITIFSDSLHREPWDINFTCAISTQQPSPSYEAAYPRAMRRTLRAPGKKGAVHIFQTLCSQADNVSLGGCAKKHWGPRHHRETKRNNPSENNGGMPHKLSLSR